MLIKNVKLITPYEVMTGYAVIIKKDKIVDILPERSVVSDEHDEIIDGNEHFLAPGFIDIHNHGNSGFDIMDATEEALDNIGAFHLKNGVTSYLGTIITSSYENIIKAIDNVVNYKNEKDIAQILGAHLEGPFFAAEKKGAQPEIYIKKPDMEAIERILEASKGKLKMVSIAPEMEGALDVISYLRENEVSISMAHTTATYDEARKGVDHGITIATHIYNGMRTFSHREPGVIGLSLVDDRVYCEMIYDRIHLHDGAVKIVLKMKGLDKTILISDAMRATGLKDGDYELGGQKVIVKDGAARLEDGSLAGSTLNLHDAVYNMVNYLDVPIHEAVRMASLTPAKAINADKNKGSIEVGKDADLILIDKDINILGTIVGGKKIR